MWKAVPNEEIFKSIAKLFTNIVYLWSSQLIKNNSKKVLRENNFAYQKMGMQQEMEED